MARRLVGLENRLGRSTVRQLLYTGRAFLTRKKYWHGPKQPLLTDPTL